MSPDGILIAGMPNPARNARLAASNAVDMKRMRRCLQCFDQCLVIGGGQLQSAQHLELRAVFPDVRHLVLGACGAARSRGRRP